MSWVYLAAAIVFEVTATMALRASEGLRNKAWAPLILGGYVICFVFLSLALRNGMALGVAYLIGIVYDRVADTLMEDIEGHYRNLFAVDTGAFAEDRLRIRALRTEQSSSYAGYLRTRIRLSRALATLFPGLSCALAAWLALVENAEKHAAGVGHWRNVRDCFPH